MSLPVAPPQTPSSPFARLAAAGAGVGNWLTRPRLATYGWMFAFGQLVMFGYLALASFGILPGKAMRVGSDFLTYYGAGRLAMHGTPSVAYDFAHNTAAQVEVLGYTPDTLVPVFSYPPPMIMWGRVMTLLPFFPALLVWNCVGFALWVAALWATSRDRLATALLATFPTAFTCFYIGQTAFLNTGLLGLGLVLVERRPVVAGIVFGLLCYKPHFLMLLPVALLAARQWRCLVALGLSVLVLAAASLLLLGSETWSAYLQFVPGMSISTFNGRWGYWAYATPFSAIRILGGSMHTAWLWQAGITLLAAAATAVVWARPLPLATRAIVLVAATLLANPIIVSYDVMIGTIAMAWIVRDHARSRFPPWVKLMLCADWCIGFAGFIIAHHLDIPLMPLIGMGLLVLGLMRAGGWAGAQPTPVLIRPGPAAP